jgi:hypothetical protein
VTRRTSYLRLPAQGLIDEERRGVALRDLRGRRLAWLPGFAVFPTGHPGETLILGCGVAHGAEAAARLVLERLAPGGAIHRLTPPLAQLIPEETSLSPAGGWVAVEGCEDLGMPRLRTLAIVAVVVVVSDVTWDGSSLHISVG